MTFPIALGILPLSAMLSWGSLVVAWPTWKLVRDHGGSLLNIALADTGKIALAYSVLFAIGLGLGK